ncbi:helix-turn-helix transcriptional regulator [Streptomyces sp. XM4193]|uniref:helix-turn-helix transcriptional regulator n=1 Tax=Streptomyces sp. XM4193 TaxID=2929782 RepID=UPI001FF9F73F|nr:helix-turn-helix transcriptional regulator [Streptomyces sp. XM4193]MCK1796584.1 helix-turn-helix transcriptional regulator [Streptomyces sp. XM4193]
MAGSDRTQFGEYLRRRRAAMTPPEPPGGVRASRRRVPGLRRHELSDIAGISVEYYTRLEQGRAPRPSKEILLALARALDLSGPERDHLFRLAGGPVPGPESPDEVIRPGLLRMMGTLDDTMPVTVHDGRLDLLALNRAAEELLAPLAGSGRFSRNVAHQAFTTTGVADLLGHDGARQFLRVAAAELRSALSRYPDDPYLQDIHAELTANSPIFPEYWERGEVGARRSAIKHFNHPDRGRLGYDIEMLHDPERDHWIMLYTPRPSA